MRQMIGIVIMFCSMLLYAENHARGLIIITTETLYNTSKVFPEFVQQKQRRGFTVRVATEKDFGAAGVSGIDKALAIRKWLKEQSAGYQYLLLIGDPHPQHDGIPMVQTRPLHEYPETGDGTTPENIPIDTDMMYVNLSGNWDANGNGVFGETGLDDGPDGINFHPDFITGRIPVYDNDSVYLDAVLAYTIAYMNMQPEATGYRSRFLFPAGFYFFRGMGPMGDWDSAGLGEWARHTMLAAYPHIEAVTLYESEGYMHSAFGSSVALSRENLIAQWQQGAGVVFWGGHTFYNKILRLVWKEDTNGDDRAQKGEWSMPELLTAADAAAVASDRPGFLFSPNCNAGIVAEKGGFVAALLGTSLVGLMGATAPSTPSFTDWDCYTCPFDTVAFGSDSAGIYALKAFVEGKPPAAGLLEAKELLGSDNAALSYANKMMFNWYGDPTLTMYDDISDIIVVPEKQSKPQGCSVTVL